MHRQLGRVIFATFVVGAAILALFLLNDGRGTDVETLAPVVKAPDVQVETSP